MSSDIPFVLVSPLVANISAPDQEDSFQPFARASTFSPDGIRIGESLIPLAGGLAELEHAMRIAFGLDGEARRAAAVLSRSVDSQHGAPWGAAKAIYVERYVPVLKETDRIPQGPQW